MQKGMDIRGKSSRSEMCTIAVHSVKYVSITDKSIMIGMDYHRRRLLINNMLGNIFSDHEKRHDLESFIVTIRKRTILPRRKMAESIRTT